MDVGRRRGNRLRRSYASQQIGSWRKVRTSYPSDSPGSRLLICLVYRFISIAAGNDHLLALTSSGRTFTHPINTKANFYGQLGYRKFDVPDRSAPPHPHLHPARKQIELTPKSIVDPYANASPAVRSNSSPELDQLPAADESSIHWSDKLFEVPALRDVKVKQIAAGGRTSFALTEQGRVLGWGANEFG